MTLAAWILDPHIRLGIGTLAAFTLDNHSPVTVRFTHCSRFSHRSIQRSTSILSNSSDDSLYKPCSSRTPENASTLELLVLLLLRTLNAVWPGIQACLEIGELRYFRPYLASSSRACFLTALSDQVIPFSPFGHLPLKFRTPVQHIIDRGSLTTYAQGFIWCQTDSRGPIKRDPALCLILFLTADMTN